MSIPRKDLDLLNWSTNADARLNEDPSAYGTTSLVAAQYSSYHNGFAAAYNALIEARVSGVFSMAQTSEKAQAKRALLGFARPLYTTIQANTEVTDAAKIRIGIVVPAAKPTAHPVPNVAPGLRVESVDGRLVRFTLCDPANPNHQRLPTGVNGAIVMSFVGPTPPASPSVCKFEGNMSRATGQVLFPQSVEPGTQVWLIASYFNQRKQSGPACAAVGVIVNYPASIPMAA